MDYVDLVCSCHTHLQPYFSSSINNQPPFLDAHRPDKHTPMEEVVRAFNYLINTGQALYWGRCSHEKSSAQLMVSAGTSEWSAEEITDAWRVAEKLGKREWRLVTCLISDISP